MKDKNGRVKKYRNDRAARGRKIVKPGVTKGINISYRKELVSNVGERSVFEQLGISRARLKEL